MAQRGRIFGRSTRLPPNEPCACGCHLNKARPAESAVPEGVGRERTGKRAKGKGGSVTETSAFSDLPMPEDTGRADRTPDDGR